MSSSVQSGERHEQDARSRQLVADLERAWRQARGKDDAPSIAPLLPQKTDPNRAATLDALVRADLQARWQRRIFTYLEQYLEQFPELGSANDVAASLIIEEYRIRHQFGDQPAIENYSERFPAQYAAIQQLIQGEQFHTLQAPPPMHQPAESRVAASIAPPPSPAPAEPIRYSGAARADLIPINIGYKLIERIGRGNYGDVWKAENTAGGFEAAIKIIMRPLDHDDVKRELQSLEAIKRVRHSFLLQTYAYWPLEDRLIIAMELANSTLNDRLKKSKAQGGSGVPVEELLDYFKESAEALDYLHTKNVFHRDIKPANILLLGGHVKVGDFGLARLQEENRLMSATFCGTPYYMAPEIWEGKLGPTSDQYSLAVTYVELRLGRLPFTGRNISELALNHQQTVPDLPGLSPGEKDVVLRALAKDPDKRYPNCKEFTAALDEAARPRKRQSGSTTVDGMPLEIEATRPYPPLNTTDRTAPSTVSGHVTDEHPGRQTVAGGRLSGTIADDLPTPIPIKERGSGLFVGVLIGMLLLAGLGFYLVPIIFPPTPPPDPPPVVTGSISIEKPRPVQLATRDKDVPIKIHVKRTDYSKLIKVRLDEDDLKKLGLTAAEVELEGGKEEATIKLSADAQIRKSPPVAVLVVAEGDGVKDQARVEITLIPLPNNCKPVSADNVEVDVNNVKYFREIAYELPDRMKFEFVVIPKKTADYLDTFYITRDKITVEQFTPFADKLGAKLTSSEWNRLGVKVPGGDWVSKKNHPALWITGIDAYQFATQWIDGGTLPKEDQWLQAAGKREQGREGPYEGKWIRSTPLKIAVGRSKVGPMEMDENTDDISPFRVRHMSGNGMEWTRSWDHNGWTQIPDETTAEKAVSVRTLAASFQDSDPFRFTDGGGLPNFQKPPEDAIGFRVVIQP